MGITVSDFVYGMTDDSVEIAIYDFSAEKEIFCGEAREASYDYGEYEVSSFDVDTMSKRGVYIILNIETEEDDD